MSPEEQKELISKLLYDKDVEQRIKKLIDYELNERNLKKSQRNTEIMSWVFPIAMAAFFWGVFLAMVLMTLVHK